MISFKGEIDRNPLGLRSPWDSVGHLTQIKEEPEQLIGVALRLKGKPASCKEGPDKEKEWKEFLLG